MKAISTGLYIWIMILGVALVAGGIYFEYKLVQSLNAVKWGSYEERIKHLKIVSSSKIASFVVAWGVAFLLITNLVVIIAECFHSLR